MNSVKNLLVIVLLMGVSYGAYQVITTPEPDVDGEAAGIDELNIQIGSRNEDLAGSTLEYPGADSDDSAMALNMPEMPPLPPGAIPGNSNSNESLSVPELQVPDLVPPQLENPIETLPNDPQALADANGNANVDSGSQFNAPPVSPPTRNRSDAAAKPLAPPTESGVVAQNGGQFSPQPDTALEPVTPKSETQTPAESMSEFVDNARSRAESLQSPGASGGFQPMTPPSDTYASSSAATGEVTPAPATGTSINWEGIRELANTGQPTAALKQLSRHYNSELTQQDRMKMQEWLDLLAGKVIYSTEHLLSPQPHVVQSNETLESIAQAWNVPAQLIYNVNQTRIDNPSMLVPGTELKMIQGPFNAEVSLDRSELTLFLDGMYAGRFPVELGTDGQGIPHGSFMVEQKLPGREYTGTDGQVVAAQSPDNPYGKYWIGLNEQLAIHETSTDQLDQRGSIRLGSRDAADVYGILSNGSQVTIHR